MAKKPSRASKKPNATPLKIAVAAGLVIVLLLAIVAFWHHRAASPAVTPTPTPSASASPMPTATPSPSPTPSSVASTGGQCGNLAASLDTTGGGTAGTIYRQVVLTNHSTQTCTIAGFPGVSLVDAAGTQLGSPAARDGAAGPVVTLAPSQSAASPVGFPEAANFASGTCSTTSTSLKVYPPNQTTALTVPLAAQYCPGFSVQTLVAH